MPHSLAAILHQLPLGAAVLDARLQVVFANPSLSQRFSAPELTAELETLGAAQQSCVALRQAFKTDPVRVKDGAVKIALAPLADGGWLATLEDAPQDALVLQNQRLDAALRHMPHGWCMFDADWRLIACNAAYARLYDLPEPLLQPGVPLSTIIDYRQTIGNAPSDMPAYFDFTAAASLRSSTASAEIGLCDGRTIKIAHNPITGGGYVATHEDITEQVRAAQQISFLARHDPLTGLPNRMLLREKLEHELTFSRAKRPLAVACLDLDHFKEVNDTLGHPIGDQLLKAATQRLQDALRGGDTIARFGGDEFVILLADIEKQRDAAILAQRMIESIARPFELSGHQIEIGASVGIALYPDDASDVDVLISRADLALYRAKTEGRGDYRFFEPEMDAKMQDRRKLELDLRHAIRAEEFEIHYQPQIDARSKALLGFEALLRWRHPERGLLPPADFIPLAEETGLIIAIGEWVLRRACHDAVSWPRPISLAVNVSPAQFKSRSLAHAVVAALVESGLAPSRLELEITESVLLADSDFALATLKQIKTLGVRIAMDDFGVGYSSLSYLRLFAFDKIKIDRSFINELSLAGDAAAIVKAVITLGASLGIVTTAEGVETEEQLAHLCEQGCQEAQGFLIGRPAPVADIRHFFDPASTLSVA